MTKLYTFPHFDFVHGIVVLESIEKVEQMAENLKNAESSLMSYLNNYFNQKVFSYNLIGCEEFLMIVPRKKKDFLNKMDLNSIGKIYIIQDLWVHFY